MKYNKKALWEITFPFFISIIFLILLLSFGANLSLDFEKLISNGISIFGILLGFFITILTIFNTMDNKYIRAIRNEELTYSLFINYLRNAIWLSFYIIILGFTYEFALVKSSFPIKDFVQILLFFLICWAILSSYRFINLFVKIIIP